jgi:SUMO ligase MMS21 Smc5/6 complex component
MSSYLSRVRPDGEEDDDDTSDIEMGGQTLEYKCPITLKPFEDAMARWVPPPS